MAWEELWDDVFSDERFQTSVAREHGHPRWAARWPVRWPARWAEAEELLWIASALLLGTNLLLLLAVFASLMAGLGPLTPRILLTAAFTMDLPGAALLAWIVWDASFRTRGTVHRVRRAAALLLISWVGMTALWRFMLPGVLGTNVVDLFASFLVGPAEAPATAPQDLAVLYNLFAFWIAAAAAFAAAHVLLAIARPMAAPDDWVRGLPTSAWAVGAGISFLATLFLVASFLEVLAGRALVDNLNAWLVAKLVVAPNFLISGYASSLDLGRKIRSGVHWSRPRWARRP